MAGTQRPGAVSTKQQQIAELARQSPPRGFTSLNHYLDIPWLIEACYRTRGDGAPGVDGQTGADYGANLWGNLQSLLGRAKSGTYRAPPVRRVHIPKGPGSAETRPLGIPMVRAYCTPYQKPWEWVSCRWCGLVCLRPGAFQLLTCPPAYTTMLIVTTASSSAAGSVCVSA
jgi:hypothetical protein